MNLKDTQLALDLIDAAYLARSGNSTWDEFVGRFGRAFPELIPVRENADSHLVDSQKVRVVILS